MTDTRNDHEPSGAERLLGDFAPALVHYTDGVEGAHKRLMAAEKVVSDFGIATECGFGRRPRAQDIRELLGLHTQIAAL